VLDGRADDAFCAIRPPGHHATRSRAMGFCFYNNLAVGVAHALAAHGLERVAILDFDVHHGNGTEAILRNDDRVLFCSSYRHPFYPHAPVIENHPRILHTPLSPGNARGQFRNALEQRWLPALEAFQPQLVFLSAGFDAHREDDMGGLDFGDDDYQWATLRIIEVAERCCQGRIISVLEGGYHLPALARSVERHLRALMSVHHVH
jgi:acetoin utilization deacetylase AcuC-like enzyme